MQRPIKFRAWHRFTKIMFKHVCKLEFSNWNGEEHHLVSVFARNHDDQARLDEAKNWELLQFTGLKDKNGKEIYEGDILQIDDSSPRRGQKIVVSWEREKSGFFPFTGYYLQGKNFLEVNPSEIIGNVHEHPRIQMFMI